MCKKLIYLISFILVLVAVPLVTYAQVDNLVLNPSFEEDEVILNDEAYEHWWTWGWEDGLNSTVEIDETEFVDGKRSIWVNPKGDTNWYFMVDYSPIACKAGTNYTTSVWVKAEEPRPFWIQFKATDNSSSWGQEEFELTTEWAEYSITSEAQSDELKIELYCAGSEVPLWIDCVLVYEGEYVPGIKPVILPRENAAKPIPADGAVDEDMSLSLSWQPGDYAATHDVYFGENFDDVNEASRTDPRGVLVSQDQKGTIYESPGFLEFAQTYYWRVDEVNDAEPNSPWKGTTWTFTIIDHFVMEDFEDYNNYTPDMIFETWLDGYEVPTNGALIGHDADFSKGEHIVETTVIRGGTQSMPYYYNNVGTVTYSEAERAFSPAQDWTREGVGVLSLWFRGYPAYMGSFVEGPTGTYTMTAEGADIWGNADQFHFAWKELSGAGSIVAKVESVSDTDPWAKAGVMIRDTLDADSRHAMMVITPTQGVSFQRRRTVEGSSSEDTEAGITAPQWVKLERTAGGFVRAYYSTDGSTWTQLGTPLTMTMNTPMYIGLAVTSHNAGVACEAVFSNVTSDGTGQWVDQDIGLINNEAQPMYVTVKDSSGTSATVYHDDPDASLISTWTQWEIDLKEVGDAGVVLTDVGNLAIGFGDRDNPQAGSGLVFFDDIRLYRPTR
jgi:hypothetical protein